MRRFCDQRRPGRSLGTTEGQYAWPECRF
jgi:hypothetical protein